PVTVALLVVVGVDVAVLVGLAVHVAVLVGVDVLGPVTVGVAVSVLVGVEVAVAEAVCVAVAVGVGGGAQGPHVPAGSSQAAISCPVLSWLHSAVFGANVMSSHSRSFTRAPGAVANGAH